MGMPILPPPPLLKPLFNFLESPSERYTTEMDAGSPDCHQVWVSDKGI